jgi:hypothetical protein
MAKKEFTEKQIAAAAAAIVGGDNGEQPLAEYLKDLLATLWEEEENFSGKRPFGNSGWQFDVYAALIKAGLIKGKLDEDGYIVDVDRPQGESLVLAVIKRFHA